ncbi:sulfurtransferase [Sporosarcina gallistercoris]|uniref:Sulfurtransferase n=1 Tax=Sporosarcina gallistercoris TaxID=2762245 RepID=A0ABR8PFH3_9BACL|nr:sulfurtransferase [Sporosarcina gallistercoris]MBD7906914.1 sulfurtransferase [Sporosarcina gallistercoris]
MNVFKSLTEQNRDEPYKWIDARFSLTDPEAGSHLYSESHIVNAIHWDLEKDLSDMQKSGGRHPLPDQETLTELYRKSGLHLDDEIIIYDNGGEPFAARAWWILQFGGFKNVSISLEGFEELVNLGFPSDSNTVHPERSLVVPEWNPSILASKEDVKNLIETKQDILLDARAAARYRGEHEPLDAIAGHIPGARNFDWAQLTENGRFETSGEGVRGLVKMADPQQPITVYCGSGVTAAPLYAMLTEKGYSYVRLYAGSYSDWIADGDLPIETGAYKKDDLL